MQNSKHSRPLAKDNTALIMRSMKLIISFAIIALLIAFPIPTLRRSLGSNKYEQSHNTKPPTVLLGIFSYSEGADRRKYIRDTYLKDAGDSFCSLEEYTRQKIQETLTHQHCRFPYTFIIGGGSDERPTDHTDDAQFILAKDTKGNSERDCTYLNIKENMEDGKSPTFLRFAAKIANTFDIDYVVKLDDDTLLGTELFNQFVDQNLPPAPYNTRIYGGFPRLSRLQNHIYTAGEFYFMSSDLAKYVANTLSFEDRKDLSIHIEDLDMGSYIHSHHRPVTFINLFNFVFYIHPLKTEKSFREHYAKISNHLPKQSRMLPWKFYCPAILSGDSK